MPSYLDLLNQRVTANSRPHFKARVCLVPDAESELRALQASPAQRRTIADTGPDPARAAQVSDLQDRISQATLVVTLQAPSVADLAIARAGTDSDTPVGQMWQADLVQAFVEARNDDGALVEDVGRAEWARLLAVLPAAQVQAWHGQLGQVGAPIDFPTRAKS